MHNILITGHEGFHRSRTMEKITPTKHDLMGLDIKSGDDILTCELPIPNVVDVVIHLAGIGGVRESLADPKSIGIIMWKALKEYLIYSNGARVCGRSQVPNTNSI